MIPAFDPQGAMAIGIIVAASFVAAIVKGVTTMGLGIVGVSVIAAFIDVQTAILSLFGAKCVSDIVMMFESKRMLSWRLVWRLRWFAIAGFVAVTIATYLLANLPGRVLFIVLGAAIVGFIFLQLRTKPIHIPIRHEQPWGALFGAATGLGQGLTGIGGPQTAMYLYSMHLTTAEFVFMSCSVYVFFDVGQMASILYLDLYNPTLIFYSLAVFLPVMAGTWVGIRIRHRIPAAAFRYAVLAVLFATAIGLIVRGMKV